MKNIAIVSNTSWYIYNFRKGLLSKLVEQGYKVYVISPKDKFVNEIESIGCVFIELSKISNQGKNPFQDILLIKELKDLFKQYKISCSLFFTPKINIYGSIAAKLSNTKAIATINGLGFVFNEGQSKWLKWVVKKMYAFAFKNVPVVFFQNHDDKLFFQQTKILNPNHRIFIVRGSGVNLIEFYPKTTYNDSDKLTFLLSARLIKEKGVYEYIEAAKQIKSQYPNIKFALLGVQADNPSAVPLDVIHQYHKDGIIDYWGLSDNMSVTLDKVDVMVLPSYYREGVPKILIEALSKALPIITTWNVGCKETVDEFKNGYLIPVKNVEALTYAIENIIHLSPAKRIEMGKYSRAKAVAEFDELLNHKEYIQQIELLTKND